MSRNDCLVFFSPDISALADTRQEYETELSFITNEIIDKYKEKGKRETTLFYDMVLSGNIAAAKQILLHLEQNGMRKHLQWLLDLELKQERTCSRLLHLPVGIILLIFWIILTPLFYLIHSLVISVADSTLRGLSRDTRLPLAFAAMSVDQQSMVALFKSYGVPINSVDQGGNNVFHYLVDFSEKHPMAAATSFSVILQEYENVGKEQFKHLLNKANNRGLSPLEMCFKLGTFRFLRVILSEEGLMKRSMMRIDCISSINLEASDNISRRKTQIFAERAHYDVTPYESGDFMGRQSLPLCLLSNTPVLSLQEAEIYAMQTIPLITAWLKKKKTLIVPIVLLLQVLDVALSFLIVLFMYSNGGDMNTSPLFYDFTYYMLEAREDLLGSNASTTSCPNTTYYGQTVDACEARALSHLEEQCQMGVVDVMKQVGYFLDMDYMIAVNSFSLDVFSSISCSLIIVDIISRAISVIRIFCKANLSVKQRLFALMGKHLPGSYTVKQLNMLSFFNLVALLAVYGQYISALQTERREQGYAEVYLYYTETLTYLTILCLFLRILSHIHSLQLVPGIGNFAISTLAMMPTLIRFLVVYLFVLVTFATIFHFIMRDPDCLGKKIPDFETFFSSCLATFRLTFGHGDFYYDSFLSVQVTYILYVIICLLLLLNLVIAIMGTISNKTMADPWRNALWQSEILKELLSIESLFQLMTWPCSCNLHPALLKCSGFIVKQTKDRRKIYIETTEKTEHEETQ